VFFRRNEAKLVALLDKLLAGEQPQMPTGLLEEKIWQVLKALEQSEQKSKAEHNNVLTLMGDISHQLKTPLASLLLHLDLLDDSSLTDLERTNFIIECKKQTQKIGWLTDSLLKIARLESGLISVKKIHTDFAETLNGAIATITAQAEVKGLAITATLPNKLKVQHDPTWTREALCNILDNAVKYTDTGGITITLEEGSIYTRIDIADTGIGFAAEEYTKIFSRFYRVRNNAVGRIEGTGLGLTIAREIMRQQDGNITVSSELGKGSTFSVFLQNC